MIFIKQLISYSFHAHSFKVKLFNQRLCFYCLVNVLTHYWKYLFNDLLAWITHHLILYSTVLYRCYHLRHSWYCIVIPIFCNPFLKELILLFLFIFEFGQFLFCLWFCWILKINQQLHNSWAQIGLLFFIVINFLLFLIEIWAVLHGAWLDMLLCIRLILFIFRLVLLLLELA